MDTNRETFDQIAESWYRVRHWPLLRAELEEVALRWESGALLNVGCGHGADFLPFGDTFRLYGVDSSAEMIRQALRYSTRRGLRAQLAVADARWLPFPDNTFDWAISVAAYHHIRGRPHQEQAFSELRRVMKPGSQAFLTVWNRGQRRFWFRRREQQIPWRLKDRTVYRYYHLFSYRELADVLEESGLKVIGMFPEKSFHLRIKQFSRNICALVTK